MFKVGDKVRLKSNLENKVYLGLSLKAIRNLLGDREYIISEVSPRDYYLEESSLLSYCYHHDLFESAENKTTEKILTQRL